MFWWGPNASNKENKLLDLKIEFYLSFHNGVMKNINILVQNRNKLFSFYL